MIKVGDKFIGSADGTIFEVIEFRDYRKSIGLRPDYVLKYGTKYVNATDCLLIWLLKSGGLIQV